MRRRPLRGSIPRRSALSRTRSRGKNGLLESQRSAIDLDGVGAGEACAAEIDIDPETAKALGAVVMADVGPQSPQSFHDGREVHANAIRNVDAEVRGIA